jgi:pimeloyl-ACP methyl ester carboxylesterase
VLLAPALDFGGNRLRDFGPYGIDEWKRLGSLRVHHYGFDEPRDISYALYEDAAAYDAFAIVPPVPTLVVQGRRDTVVDPAMVGRWARDRANVALRLVDDDHQLKANLPGLWREVSAFLGLTTDPAGSRR